MGKLPILITFVLLFAFGSTQGQWNREWSMGYTFANPMGKMKFNINQGHGVVLDFYLVSPDGRYSLGTDFNYTIYGYDQSMQDYVFPDGTLAQADVHVSNSFLNWTVAARYNLMVNRVITPYVGAKVGYAWYRTDLNIYDPDDLDNCAPLDRDILMKDGTMIVSLGGGIQYDLAHVFKKLEANVFLLNLSAYYTQGGQVSYMNADGPEHHTTSTDRTGEVTADFINTQTQIVHQHHVGNLYSSYARMMDFRLAFTFRAFR